MRRAAIAFAISGVFVCGAMILGIHQRMTPVPFFVLLPGIFTVALVPNSGFDLKDGAKFGGVVTTSTVMIGNVLLYAALFYVILYLTRPTHKE